MDFRRSIPGRDHRLQTGSGSNQAPIQWVPETLSLGIKQLGREADHSPPSSAEVNAWSCISTPPYVFIAWCLLKGRDSFTYLSLGLSRRVSFCPKKLDSLRRSCVVMEEDTPNGVGLDVFSNCVLCILRKYC
jgi:hypothetical protein